MMMLKRYHVLLGALLTATVLTGGAALYGQAPTSPWDATQLPENKGTVKQYMLTPRGDVDGLILTDGTEIKLPPHLSAQVVFAIKPGDAVSVRGLRARTLSLVDATSGKRRTVPFSSKAPFTSPRLANWNRIAPMAAHPAKVKKAALYPTYAVTRPATVVERAAPMVE
jgi:hypothetical protein